MQIRNNVENFTLNVENVEKLHHKLLRIERELAISFSELGGSIDSLGAMG